MNPATRLLGLSLLILLSVLAAVLAGPVVTSLSPPPLASQREGAANTARSTPLATLPQRLGFPLALTSLIVAAGLLVSLAFRAKPGDTSRPPFAAAKTEIGALAKLAQTSAAQGEALAHERGGRQRAEENALLNQQLLNRSLEEKIRLGRDLHDGIIQSLYAAGLMIESARAVANADPAEADRRLAQCLQNLNQSIRDVRVYVVGLSPENLRFGGFAHALETLVNELRGSREVVIDMKIDDAATVLLSEDQSTEALQIAREAISNSLRHGGATSVTIRLHQGDGEIGLLVQDNGSGFRASERAGSGHGLGNMQARAKRIGATFRIESNPGEGSRVVLTLPLRASV
jgi:signal transduction histidine kinase